MGEGSDTMNNPEDKLLADALSIAAKEFPLAGEDSHHLHAAVLLRRAMRKAGKRVLAKVIRMKGKGLHV